MSLLSLWFCVQYWKLYFSIRQLECLESTNDVYKASKVCIIYK